VFPIIVSTWILIATLFSQCLWLKSYTWIRLLPVTSAFPRASGEGGSGDPFLPPPSAGWGTGWSPVSFSRWHRRPGRCTGTLQELGISGRAVERRRGEVRGSPKEGRSFLPSPRRQLDLSVLQHGLDRPRTWVVTVTQNFSPGSCFLRHQHKTAFSELATSRRRYTKANSRCRVPKFLTKCRPLCRHGGRGGCPKPREQGLACPHVVNHSTKPGGF